LSVAKSRAEQSATSLIAADDDRQILKTKSARRCDADADADANADADADADEAKPMPRQRPSNLLSKI
jgi:hypothetical protein